MLRRGIVSVLAVALLQACASNATKPLDTVEINTRWAERQQQLAAVRGFALNGRVAVKGGGLSGALRWQQDGEHFVLRIAGPFGAGALAIEGTPALVAIKGKEIDLVTTEPQQVLAQRTGWRLPLDSLRWWVLGLPDPTTPASTLLDAEGRATQIRQGEWTLVYSDYRNDPEPALPGRIEASRPVGDGVWMATLVPETLTLTR